MEFPKKLRICLIDLKDGSKIRLKNIVISLKFFANYKNDYNLGPFFSDENGEYSLDSKILSLSAQAELAAGLMDYDDYHNCKNDFEIRILNDDAIKRLKIAREKWGILKVEETIYKTKESLLAKIKTANNHKVMPNNKVVRVQSPTEVIEVILETKLLG